jgi:hypothetical protein
MFGIWKEEKRRRKKLVRIHSLMVWCGSWKPQKQAYGAILS